MAAIVSRPQWVNGTHLKPEMFLDSERADEDVLLLDVGRDAGHPSTNGTSVYSDIALDRHTTSTSTRQDIEQGRLAGTTS